MRRMMSASCSAFCAACQKKRYGEMVVPMIATNVSKYSREMLMCGTNVPRNTCTQSAPANIAAKT